MDELNRSNYKFTDDIILAASNQSSQQQHHLDSLSQDLDELQRAQLVLNAYNLSDILSDTRDLDMFKRFLLSHNSLDDLLCWMDIQEYWLVYSLSLSFISDII